MSAAPQIAISQLPNGGKIQPTDSVPATRAGVTMRTNFGTMAAQNFDSVSVTGGSIDDVIIGEAVPQDGYFNHLNSTGLAILQSIQSDNIESSISGAIVADGTLSGYDVYAGHTLSVSNKGTFTANGTTAVSVTNNKITANSVILFGLKTIGGTPACAPYESAITVSSGFSVKACAGDTSTYNYTIIN